MSVITLAPLQRLNSHRDDVANSAITVQLQKGNYMCEPILHRLRTERLNLTRSVF